MQNTLLSFAPPDGSVASDAVEDFPTAIEQAQPIAPWWHTAALVGVLAFWVTIGHLRGAATSTAPQSLTYASQMLVSWLLFGSVVAGIRHRDMFFFNTLQRYAGTWTRELRFGIVVYLLGMGMASTAACTVWLAKRTYDHHHHVAATQTSARAASSPVAPPSSDKLFDTGAVRRLGPRSGRAMLTWILLSFTAGFCEEHIFRGYFLEQARAFFTRFRLKPRASTAAAVMSTAALFGSMHLYQGLQGAIAVTVLGVVYALAAIKLRSLRAVIIAHTLQDTLSGLLLYVAHIAKHSA